MIKNISQKTSKYVGTINLPQNFKKIKTIVLAENENIGQFENYFEKLEINKYIDYRIITPETFNSKPFGEDPEVEILGVDWAMSDLVNQILEDNPSVKWVHGVYAGVEHFQTPEIKAKANRITLSNAKGAFSKPVAEYVAFAMMWFAKKGKKYLDDKVGDKWEPTHHRQLSDSTMGLLGFGSVGQECAKIAKYGFSMKVLACKRDISKVTDLQTSLADEILPNSEEGLARLFQESDFVVNTMPFTPSTVNFFDTSKFNQMKESAVFINVGRGVSVVEEDIVKALKEGKIAGAYMDVQAREPLPADSELRRLDNVIMTPHCAHATENKDDDMFLVFKQNLEGYIQKGRSVEGLNSKVDFEAGY